MKHQTIKMHRYTFSQGGVTYVLRSWGMGSEKHKYGKILADSCMYMYVCIGRGGRHEMSTNRD
jgi:hypothetical protein